MGQSVKTKLGIKDQDVLLLFEEPKNYYKTVELNQTNKVFHLSDHMDDLKVNFIHIFIRNLHDLEKAFFSSIEFADSRCMVWISWLKGTNHKKQEINRDQIRAYLLSNSNWVDTKVCSYDEDWSGLKFLRRVK